MNRAKYYSILTIFFLLFMPLYNIGQNIRLEILDIREINDSLQINYQIEMKNGDVSNRQAVHLKPVLLVEKHRYPLRAIIIAGKNKQQVLHRWSKNYNKQLPVGIINANFENDSIFNFETQVPYPLKTDSVYIFVERESVDSRGRHTFTTDTIARVITKEKKETSTVSPQVTLITPKEENKPQHIQKSDSLFFRIGQSTIVSAYKDNRTKLSELEEALHNIINNKNISLEAIYIEGYASPDGKYEINEALSSKRALTLKNHIKSKFNIPDSLLKTSTVAEDWTGLVALLEAKKLLTKEDIQNIESIEDNDEREAVLKQWDNGKPYSTIQKELLPQLRRVKYKICYSIKDNKQDEVEILEKNNSENISQTKSYNPPPDYGEEETDPKQLSTELITSVFPNDSVTINNTDFVMIENGELNSARNLFDKNFLSELLLNNSGRIYLLENNMEETERYFRKNITFCNKEAIYNRKNYNIKKI